MKKLLFFFMSVCTLLSFTGCKETVTEENIIGKWKLQTIVAGGETIEDGAQVWEFAENHKLFISAEGEADEYYDSGTWSLEGKTLTLQFMPVSITVSELTSSKLVLEGPGFKYTFSKLK